jgi:hypothetical protein
MLLPSLRRVLLLVPMFMLIAGFARPQTQQEPHPQTDQAASAQTNPAFPAVDPTKYVAEIIRREMDQEKQDHTRWRYRAHREDEKSNYDRDIIETKDGEIARTLLLWGRPLTAEEREKDNERMLKLVNDPDERAKRNKREREDSDKGHQMFRAIPDAFIFKYDGWDNRLLRLTFTPNPNYDPPTRELRVFRALTGKMWIDPNGQHLTRIQGTLFEDVTFGWGLLARLNKGGMFNVNLAEVAPGHWDMTSLDVNMSGHAVLFKNISVQQRQTQTDFRRVPDDLTIAQGYQLLQKDGGAVSANNHPPK